MRFSIAAVLAFAASALAADPTPGFSVITKPGQGESVPAGSAYDIVWSPSAEHPGTIKIGLLGGATPATLNVIDTIATGVDAAKGTYSWAVPSTLGDLATYGIIITLESDTDIFQYSFPFKIAGSNGGSASTSADASSSATGGSKPSSTGGAKTSSASSSSAAASSTKASSTSAAPSSTVAPSSSSFIGNLSTTAGPSQTTITTFSTTTKPTSTKASTSSVATNGVASLAAGSFAVLGGVAMAVLAM